MSPALSILVALLSILSTKTEAPACPVGAVIDRIEGERVVVVLGANGVRSIAASLLDQRALGPAREGMRVRRASDGRCVASGTDAVIEARVRGRLRALMRR
jgi:hypothetical protein